MESLPRQPEKTHEGFWQSLDHAHEYTPEELYNAQLAWFGDQMMPLRFSHLGDLAIQEYAMLAHYVNAQNNREKGE